MSSVRSCFWFLLLIMFIGVACSDRSFVASSQGTLLDPTTGGPSGSPATVPTAVTFQHPIVGFDTSDYGFGFGSENRWFCVKQSTDGQCTSYGAHLGRDTDVGETPEGTEVTAPADGIVRVTTDLTFGGYGSDSSANASYNGCVIVLEHLLGNSEPVTTLLGHLRCEGTSYSATARRGNPPVGAIVRRGQYIAHVGHYWHGSDRSVDWHHLHWAMRRGSFTAQYSKAEILPWVQGYAPRSEFATDFSTGALVHPAWLDPFVVVAGNGDPAAQAAANVRHHPPGTLLQDPDGDHWFVATDTEIASVPASVLVSDRYDTAGAVPASREEIACYRHTEPLGSLGATTLYVRPGSNAVVVAYRTPQERYDFVRWEALLSWGFSQEDIQTPSSVSAFEAYRSRGLRLLRPGTLVKADEASEVAIVTADQKRLPIVSGEVFEQAGFKWERIISLPKSVLDQVAGLRDNTRLLTFDELHRCAAPPGCPGGATSCGGGAPPGCTPGEVVTCPCAGGPEGTQMCADDGQSFLPCECTPPPNEDPPDLGAGGAGGDDDPPDAGSPALGDLLHLTYQSPVPGELSIEGWWQDMDGVNRSWGVIPCLDEDTNDDLLECDLPVPSGALVFEFQMYLPDGRYWGDQACDSGGCNAPLGTVTLTKDGMNVPVMFVPNPKGAPYYNGQVAPVP